MVFQTSEKHKIQVIRGTTKVLRVTIRDAAGELYTPQDGDVVRFGVKISSDSTRYLIEKETANITDGVALFWLSPEDTAELDCGQYRYDVGLQSGADYFNVIPHSTFAVMPNVTSKKPGNFDNEGIGEIVELEGTIEVAFAQQGACISVTGATVGQIIKIAEVDENGVPIAWEPVDFPSGGSADAEWKLITDITIPEEDAAITLFIDKDDNGNSFSCKEVSISWQGIEVTDGTDSGYAWISINPSKAGYNVGTYGAISSNYFFYTKTVNYSNGTYLQLLPNAFKNCAGRTAYNIAAKTKDIHGIEISGYGSKAFYGRVVVYGR